MDVKHFDWDEEKNQKLKLERDVSFEDMLVSIEDGGLLDVVAHPNRINQQILIVRFNSYVYLVPFVEDKERVFLKTIIPSRKATKKYLI